MSLNRNVKIPRMSKDSIKNRNKLKWVNTTLGWIVKVYFADISQSHLQYILSFWKQFQHHFIHKGLKFAVKYNKEVRNEFLRVFILYSEGKEYESKMKPFNFKSTLSDRFKNFVAAAKLKRKLLKLLLTVLYARRVFTDDVTRDLKPIKDTLRESALPFIMDIKKYLLGFCTELFNLGKFNRQMARWNNKFFLSTKSGPNGHALLASWYELTVLPIELLRDIGVVGGDKLLQTMESLKNAYWIWEMILPLSKWTKKKYSGSYRKLFAFPDKELKTRIVAMGDYWSQLALRGLHNLAFAILRKIPQDCTFDQTKFTKLITQEAYNKFACSADLTAATDRFPIKLQELLVEKLLGSSFARSWSNIMVGHAFGYKEGKNKKSENIVYGAGNPMGFLSSWAIFALSHHFILYCVCKVKNIRWESSKYLLLGDDIVIFEQELANGYLELIQNLGVSISMHKTHMSQMGTFEFAKRWVFQGQEVSPFPLFGLSSAGKGLIALTQFLSSISGQGWSFADSNLSSLGALVTDFISYHTRVTRKKFLENLCMKSNLANTVTQMLQRRTDLVALFKNFCELSQIEYRVQLMHQDFCKSVMNRIAYDALFKQLRDGVTFGLTASELNGLLLTWQSHGMITSLDYENVHKNCPILKVSEQVLLNIEEIEVSGLYSWLESTGDYIEIYRAFTAPKDDSIFSNRTSLTIFRTSGRLIPFIKKEILEISRGNQFL